MLMNISEIQQQFNELEPRYRKLASLLKGSIQDSLTNNNIGYARIEFRIKTWDSFFEKIKRKKYDSPFDELHDLCGFRIIVRNSEEIDPICDILKKEFDMIEDESNDPLPNEFGYRSYHLVMSIKEEWKVVPEYRNYPCFKFEIQVRSELMDTWANISHQIFYKKSPLGKLIERRLYRLSALMELGDAEISNLIISQTDSEMLTGKLHELQEVLDKYLPGRKKSPSNPLSALLEEMEAYNFSIETLIEYLRVKKNEILKIEQEAFAKQINIPAVESRWWQIGVVRGIMYLTIDEYWLKEGTQWDEHFVSVIENYRNKHKFAL